jgi:polyhydroxybutyrate depolymerase
MLCGAAIERSACAETLQLTVDGQPRTYLLERPSARGPSPTVIMLHGANGTAEGIAQQTGLARLGPDAGFAVVFPQSRANVWNRFAAGKEPPQAIGFFRQFGGLPNDFGFLKMLVADLVRRGISDPARMYLAGLSNGGFMTLSMYCFESGIFAGIGLLITSMTEQTGEDCRPAKPVPTVVINGTADVVVPDRGGPVAPVPPPIPGLTFSVWSTNRLVSHFRKLNGCAQPAAKSVLAGTEAGCCSISSASPRAPTDSPALRGAGSAARHCTLMFAASITFLQVSSSALICSANSSGVLASGS